MKIIAWPAFKTKYKNPYNWLLYTHISQNEIEVREFSFKAILQEKYDIFHFHWPVETIVRHPNLLIAWTRARLMLVLIDWVRYKGTRIIWTVHDQKPHLLLHSKLAQWFESEFLKRVDGYINLCEYSQVLTYQSFPILQDCANTIIPHGHYREVYPNQISKTEAREKLDIPENTHVLMFLGYIDYYKNIPKLIQTFKDLNLENWMLVIAGKPEVSELAQEIIKLANSNPRIKLKLEFIPDEQIQTYLKAADFVILPFQEILNSGSAILALSFDCPILVPHQGALSELQAQVGTDWVKLYEGTLTTGILREALNWAVETGRLPKAPLEALDWSKLSQQTLNFYKEVITHSSG
ncbi:MAG: glycosyltransferase [Cyanobacteriota bacterium]|nr:glycosyltransferase [Cyanobacteriota bacterium]